MTDLGIWIVWVLVLDSSFLLGVAFTVTPRATVVGSRKVKVNSHAQSKPQYEKLCESQVRLA
jgi:hypothetical protein